LFDEGKADDVVKDPSLYEKRSKRVNSVAMEIKAHIEKRL